MDRVQNMWIFIFIITVLLHVTAAKSYNIVKRNPLVGDTLLSVNMPDDITDNVQGENMLLKDKPSVQITDTDIPKVPGNDMSFDILSAKGCDRKRRSVSKRKTNCNYKHDNNRRKRAILQDLQPILLHSSEEKNSDENKSHKKMLTKRFIEPRRARRETNDMDDHFLAGFPNIKGNSGGNSAILLHPEPAQDRHAELKVDSEVKSTELIGDIKSFIEDTNDETNDESKESDDEIEEADDEIEESDHEIEEADDEIEELDDETEESDDETVASHEEREEFGRSDTVVLENRKLENSEIESSEITGVIYKIDDADENTIETESSEEHQDERNDHSPRLIGVEVDDTREDESGVSDKKNHKRKKRNKSSDQISHLHNASNNGTVSGEVEPEPEAWMKIRKKRHIKEFWRWVFNKE